MMGRYLVFNIGCIECGVSSNVVGVYETKDEALVVAKKCDENLGWREHGQNAFAVFDLLAPQAEEYRDVLK